MNHSVPCPWQQSGLPSSEPVRTVCRHQTKSRQGAVVRPGGHSAGVGNGSLWCEPEPTRTCPRSPAVSSRQTRPPLLLSTPRPPPVSTEARPVWWPHGSPGLQLPLKPTVPSVPGQSLPRATPGHCRGGEEGAPSGHTTPLTAAFPPGTTRRLC